MFNRGDGLAAILATLDDADSGNDRVKLTRYDLTGTVLEAVVPLDGEIRAIDKVLALDFGAGGIGGNPNSNAGDGYYALALDLDNDGTLETVRHFYRLLGDVTGDRWANSADVAAIGAAIGRRGTNLEEDANGDGVVDSRDRSLAYAASLANGGTGRSLAAGLLLDD
jgi:hypothetical protein